MAWYNANYKYRKKIIIDHTKVDTALTNYPIRVLLTSSNFTFSKSRDDGDDIIFTKSDGTTLLKFERVYHDKTNSLSEFHVKVPAVSASVDTNFYMYYDYSEGSTDLSDGPGVWDSNYKLVMHLGGGLNDSTNNNNDGTAIGTTVGNDSSKGKYRAFNGSSDKITVPHSANINFNGYSDSYDTQVFARAATTLNACYFIAKFADAANGYPFVVANDSGAPTQYGAVWDRTYGPYVHGPVTAFPLGTNFHLIAFNVNHAADKLYFSIDTGAPSSTTNTVTSSTLAANSNPVTIGRTFNGDMQEVRLSNINRSSGWKKADYYNLCNCSLISMSSETAITMIRWIDEPAVKKMGPVANTVKVISPTNSYTATTSPAPSADDVVAKIFKIREGTATVCQEVAEELLDRWSSEQLSVVGNIPLTVTLNFKQKININIGWANIDQEMILQKKEHNLKTMTTRITLGDIILSDNELVARILDDLL